MGATRVLPRVHEIRVVSVPRFIKVPPKEAPPEPVEKPLDEGVAAAWTTALAELRGPTESEEARRERARRERALLIAKPPQLRSREKKRPARTDEPDFKKLKGAVLRATIVALDALEDQGTDFTTLQKHELLELVKKQANKKSLSLRTLARAESFRRKHPL